jgi:hypothetical protein
MPQERRKQIRQNTKAECTNHLPADYMVVDLTMHELNKAISSLQTKKAPGPDGVTNDMLRRLGPKAKQVLISIYNTSWKEGTVPTSWKTAHIISIHKKGKDKACPDSYGPISLLSCIGKQLETNDSFGIWSQMISLTQLRPDIENTDAQKISSRC